MPELPEVETVVRGLRLALPGRRFMDVRLGKTDFIDDPPALERKLPGRRVTGIQRAGKYIVVDLEPSRTSQNGADPSALLIHLGMTGQVVICRPQAPVPPHTHAFFALDDGRELRYTDIRRFGRMAVLSAAERERVLGPLGVEPLEVPLGEFGNRIVSRRARVKALLMDQRVFRGMGNIYTDESLFRAHVHPMRIGAGMKRDEIARLYRAVRAVLTEAIRLGGSTISDYIDSNGQPGEFQLRHRVYGREGKNCFRCGARIERAIVAGRSSYFCPRCQRPPRARRVKRRPSHRQRRIRTAPKTTKIPA